MFDAEDADEGREEEERGRSREEREGAVMSKRSMAFEM